VVRMRPGEEATIGTLVNMAGSSNLVMDNFLLLSLEQNYFYFRVSSSNQVGNWNTIRGSWARNI